VADHEGGLDDKDPWAGSIAYPPLAPAQYVTDATRLEADTEQRCWVQGEDRADVLWSQLWKASTDLNDRDEEREEGHRLQGTLPFLTGLLLKFGMNMIIDVQIERRASFGRRGSSKENDFGFVPPSARIFVVTPDSGLYTV
jgi:hypothetical protein